MTVSQTTQQLEHEDLLGGKGTSIEHWVMGIKNEPVLRALKFMARKDPSKLASGDTHCREVFRPISSNQEKGLNKACLHSDFI